MSYKHLLYEKEGNIATVTINRPDVLNALDSDTFREIGAVFQEIEDAPEARVVILTGRGEKAFIAGVDVRDMKDKTTVEIEEFVGIARRAGDRIYNLSKPVIAAVNGFALGGGFEVALCCDIILASENARVGQPEISLGIIPADRTLHSLRHK